MLGENDNNILEDDEIIEFLANVEKYINLWNVINGQKKLNKRLRN